MEEVNISKCVGGWERWDDLVSGYLTDVHVAFYPLTVNRWIDREIG